MRVRRNRLNDNWWIPELKMLLLSEGMIRLIYLSSSRFAWINEERLPTFASFFLHVEGAKEDKGNANSRSHEFRRDEVHLQSTNSIPEISFDSLHALFLLVSFFHPTFLSTIFLSTTLFRSVSRESVYDHSTILGRAYFCKDSYFPTSYTAVSISNAFPII